MTRIRALSPALVLAAIILLADGGLAHARPPEESALSDDRALIERRVPLVKGLVREERRATIAARRQATIAARRLLPLSSSTARAASGPACESTGFEATEATCQWEQGWICGSTFTSCVSDHDLPKVCTGDPIVDENCCADNPNPLNGWYTSITSQHCNEPHVEAGRGVGGSNSLRFRRDPDGGANSGDGTGCTGLGSDCRNSAFTPSVGPQPIGPTTISFDLSSPQTLSQGSFNYFTMADSEMTPGGLRILWTSGGAGYVYVYDPTIHGYGYKRAYMDTLYGFFHHYEIIVDPCDGVITYKQDGRTFHLQDFRGLARTVERAVFTNDNAGTHAWDLDNYTVTRGEPCRFGCGNGEIEPGEECEPELDDDCPGLCILPGEDAECTCAVPFTEHMISTPRPGELPTSVFAADVDGDGDTDILATFSRLKIAWYENDGGSPPSFTERVISTNADRALSVFATDLDGDGDIDVLSASQNDDKIAWYENDGGSPPTFAERVISTTALRATSVFATDLDGDGDTDVLSVSSGDFQVAWYENDGGFPPTFTEQVISTTADGARSVFAADVDGDGDTDVLLASSRDPVVAWYENDGAAQPTFREREISTSARGASSVFATDVDGDGDTDVLSASFNDDTIAWYENDGGSPPTFTERVISTAANGALSVFAADLDGDGDTDVLSASIFDNKVAWYNNDGGFPPTFTEQVISTTADGARSVFATDVDGDGDTDVLSASRAASRDDDKIAWYENTAPRCGDGRIDLGEECDDRGESVTCDEDCTLAECGDGTVNATTGEECDDGIDNSDAEPDACRTNCTAAGCGDGVVDAGEECDDGNVEPGDGCDENCQVRGACCETLNGTCADRVGPESCGGTHASYHLGVDCVALDPLCAAAFGACCRDDLDQPGGIRECRSVSLNECRCPSCEWFKLRSCEEVIAEALCEPDFFPIPALSQWGLAIMTLLLLVVGKVHFGRRDAWRRSDSRR